MERMMRSCSDSGCNTGSGVRWCWTAGRGQALPPGSASSILEPGPVMPHSILAEIVGPSGEVVALERSDKFVAAMRESFRRRGLSNAKIYELDLMTGDLPKGNYDFSWCRWVLSFVSDQALLIKKLGDVMPKGGISIFHEYAHYGTWRFLPPIPSQEKFREHVDRNLARVGRRTGWRGRSPGVALAKWVYYSVGHTAYLLCASD